MGLGKPAVSIDKELSVDDLSAVAEAVKAEQKLRSNSKWVAVCPDCRKQFDLEPVEFGVKVVPNETPCGCEALYRHLRRKHRYAEEDANISCSGKSLKRVANEPKPVKYSEQDLYLMADVGRRVERGNGW
jgi:hypothetical protein